MSGRVGPAYESNIKALSEAHGPDPTLYSAKLDFIMPALFFVL